MLTQTGDDEASLVTTDFSANEGGPIRQTELTFIDCPFSCGTTICASNDPIAPPVFSRTTIFATKRPGGRVTPD